MLRTKFLFDVVAPSLLLCWAAILAYTAFVGDSGYYALSALDAALAEKETEVEMLRARRMALEKRADLLNPKSLDPDLMDERIRIILGYSREGDIVVPLEAFD